MGEKQDKELIEAAKKGNYEAITASLDAGAKINAIDEQNATSLMWAAFGGHIECVEQLLSRGALISLKNKHGQNVLDFAKTKEIRDLLNQAILERQEAQRQQQQQPQIKKTGVFDIGGIGKLIAKAPPSPKPEPKQKEEAGRPLEWEHEENASKPSFTVIVFQQQAGRKGGDTIYKENMTMKELHELIDAAVKGDD